MTTRKAVTNPGSRARARGVDLMELNPRPLRTRTRMTANDPARTVRRAWEDTFRTLDRSVEKIPHHR